MNIYFVYISFILLSKYEVLGYSRRKMQLPMFVKSSVYNATLKLGNTNENHGLPILGLQINKTKNMI